MYFRHQGINILSIFNNLIDKNFNIKTSEDFKTKLVRTLPESLDIKLIRKTH